MTSRTVALRHAPDGGAARSADRRAPVLFFLALLVLFALTATRGVASADDHASAVEGWRLATAGTPWLDDVVGGIDKNPWLHEVPNGHVVADRMIGPALICVPFYWLAGSGTTAGDFSLVPAGLAAATVTAFTGLLMFLALRRRLGARLVMLAAGAFAVATPTWSVSADGPWTHTVTQLGIAGAAYAASGRRWWLAGLFLGIGMLGRPHLALVAAVLGLGMAWTERSWRPAIGIALPSGAFLGLLLVCNRLLFGVWAVTSSGYVGHQQTLLTGSVAGDSSGTAHYTYVEGVAGFLFSPDRGLFVWTPVLLVLLPSVVRAWGEVPAWTRWLALGGLAYTLLQLRLNYFGGGTFFYGYRLGLELLTCVVPLIAFAVVRAGHTARFLALVLIAVQFGAILLGASVQAHIVVGADRVWKDNSLLMVWRALPAAVTTWMALCAGLGLIGARRVLGPRP